MTVFFNISKMSDLLAGYKIGRDVAGLTTRLERLETDMASAHEQLEAIKQAQADQKAALDGLGEKVTTEAAQVKAKLQELEDLIGQGVSADELSPVLAEAQASNQRIADAGEQISGIIPDAPPV